MPRSCVQVLTSSQHGADIWFGDPRDPRFRKNNFMQICRSQTEREFIVLCTSFGGCLTVMAQGLADFWSQGFWLVHGHVTVTTQPSLRRPFNGTWELQVGCTTWDESQESESKRVWLQSFASVQDGHRAFSVCIVLHVYVSPSFHCTFQDGYDPFVTVIASTEAAGFFDSFQWAKIDAQFATKLQI